MGHVRLLLELAAAAVQPDDGGSAGGFLGRAGANTGQNRSNHVEKSREYEIVPFRVEFRTNGFASRRAREQEGVLTTHPLIFQGSRLTVNAAAGEGRVAVEVLDEGGRPVPGYGRESCLLTTFDATQQAITWSGISDLLSYGVSQFVSGSTYRRLIFTDFRFVNR